MSGHVLGRASRSARFNSVVQRGLVIGRSMDALGCSIQREMGRIVPVGISDDRGNHQNLSW